MKTETLLFSAAALSAAFFLIHAFPAPASAEIFIMKDGARLEGEIAGRTDSSMLVKTKYGDLILKQADIKQIAKDGSAEAAADIKQTATGDIEIVNSSSLTEDSASYVFSTVVAEDGSAKIYYFRDRQIIATEKLDNNAKFISLSGSIPDKTFTEYYENGKVKTVKPMKNGRQNGTVLSYYKDGTRQFIANYKDGLKDGKFSFYTARGTLMIEAEYKNDKLNGPKKDYKADGTLDKITWYKDDEETEAPADSSTNPAAAPASENTYLPISTETGPAMQAAEGTAASGAMQLSAAAAASPVVSADNTGSAENMQAAAQNQKNKKGHSISVKSRKVARGTMYSFYVNNRYVGKARLDGDYNVLMTDGKIPDGTARLYGLNDIIQIEFIFRKGEITAVTVFDKEGNESAQYIINEKRMAVKAGL